MVLVAISINSNFHRPASLVPDIELSLPSTRYFFMKNAVRFLSIFFALVAVFLFITNPDETDFLQEVSKDYGAVHTGMQLGVNDLLQIGTSQHDPSFLWSTYRYEMGDIGVRYFGIGSMIFFQESYVVGMAPPEEEKDPLI